MSVTLVSHHPAPMPPHSSARAPTARTAPGQPAVDGVFQQVYGELYRLSAAHLNGEYGAVTVSATGLLHEAYLKLQGVEAWADEAHFKAIAARAMRQVLTQRARARTALKRGGADAPVTLLGGHLACEDPRLADDVLAIDRALDLLAAHDATLVQFVELRFFGGLGVDEAAATLGVSPRTAARMWVRAKAFLRRELRGA